MKHYSIDIPCRLETVEDINKALHEGLLRTIDHKRLLLLADKTTLHKPHALIKAREKVTKDFIKFDENKIRDVQVNFSQVDNLPLVDQFPLIAESIPWVTDIICHQDLFHFFHSLPLKIRQRFQLEHLPESLVSMYSIILAIRKLLKRELVIYVKAQKTSTLSIDKLKQSIVALTIFEPCNEDVLLALRTDNKGDSPLHQNAMAEILFARLPKTIQGLLTRNTDNLVQKLSSKMVRLNLSSRHIMNLMGYIRQSKTSEDLYNALSRLDGVAAKMSIPQEAKNKLHDYIESMKKNMDRAPSVYRSLFLSPELETCQKLYKPTKVMKSLQTVTERTIRLYTKPATLDFYPTKDFFDLVKARFSGDCTDTYLGEKQLMTSFFFNIRIFRGEKWIGNIYMLDFCEEHGSLIIDRIQIPREMSASYQQFFDHLKEVFIEMFENVPCRDILMPLKISNHPTVQKIFNKYKKKLPKKEVSIASAFADRFESLQGKQTLYGKQTYYVLHKRSEA